MGSGAPSSQACWLNTRNWLPQHLINTISAAAAASAADYVAAAAAAAAAAAVAAAREQGIMNAVSLAVLYLCGELFLALLL